MKTPRYDDFPTLKDQPPPKPVKELHSSLDDMPAIVPPAKRSLPAQEEKTETVYKSTNQQVDNPPKPQPKNEEFRSDNAVTPRHRDTTVSRNHDTTVTYPEQMIEIIRGAVKQLGKEAATHRFTIEEKRALVNIVFEYRDKQIRTSENEIARIAINYLVNDYRINGQNSLLARVLERLNK